MSGTEWMVDAACAEVYPDTFYPPAGTGKTRDALRVCAGCPVRARCAEYVMAMEAETEAEARYGVWGGMTVKQREALADRRATA